MSSAPAGSDGNNRGRLVTGFLGLAAAAGNWIALAAGLGASSFGRAFLVLFGVSGFIFMAFAGFVLMKAGGRSSLGLLVALVMLELTAAVVIRAATGI